MKIQTMITLAGAAVMLFLSSQAGALELVNGDPAEHAIRITMAGKDASTVEMVLAQDETLSNICESGCTIELENGVSQSFEGTETVYVQDGQFVIAE